MLKDKLHIFLQHLVPQHGLSRWIGKLADCRWRWWKNIFIKKFISVYQVDMSEALESDPTHYGSFNEFFVRALKPELRPFVSLPDQMACPVDGYVSEMGQIQQDQILQAKGFHYNLNTLLAGSAQLTQQFHQGAFATLYLAPKNYHRVHMPLTGHLKQMIYVPGQLFSVNQNTVQQVPNLFARNERVITVFDTAFGTMAVILVGAMIVASIETVWTGALASGKKDEIRTWQYRPAEITLKKGDELGRFKLGSTVIVLMQKDRVSWTALQAGDPVKMGQLLGLVNEKSA